MSCRVIQISRGRSLDSFGNVPGMTASADDRATAGFYMPFKPRSLMERA